MLPDRVSNPGPKGTNKPIVLYFGCIGCAHHIRAVTIANAVKYFLIIAKWGVRVPQNHFFLLFFFLPNNKITGDKPSQQLFPKLVATLLLLLN